MSCRWICGGYGDLENDGLRGLMVQVGQEGLDSVYRREHRCELQCQVDC